MTWLLLAVCCVLFVELFARAGVMRRAAHVHTVFRKAAAVIASNRISDHWKEIAVPRYARTMFLSSLSMFAALVVALSPFLAAGVIAEPFDIPFFDFLASAQGIAGACVAGLLWARLRVRFSAREHRPRQGVPPHSAPR